MARSLPPLPKARARPRGPARYKLNAIPERVDSGFLKPPLEFDSPTTSNQEWWIYLALAYVTGTPRNPFMPPFIGGDNWVYQADIGGGRVFRGGQVVDFVYDQRIGLRTQTSYWHLQQGSEVFYRDQFLAQHQRSLEKIIDLYDQTYLHDPSGAAACRVVALAIKGIQLPDPYRSGIHEVTYPRVLE